MRETYLGDSYDLVKRFWYESLKSIAPLYAHPRFVPPAIHSKYTAVTSISILDVRPVGQFGFYSIHTPGSRFQPSRQVPQMRHMLRYLLSFTLLTNSIPNT